MDADETRKVINDALADIMEIQAAAQSPDALQSALPPFAAFLPPPPVEAPLESAPPYPAPRSAPLPPIAAPSAPPLSASEQAVGDAWVAHLRQLREQEQQAKEEQRRDLEPRFGRGLAADLLAEDAEDPLERSLSARYDAPRQADASARSSRFGDIASDIAGGLGTPAPEPVDDALVTSRVPVRDLQAEAFVTSERADAPRFGSFSEAQSRRQEIETGLRDRYTQEGRFGDIGGADYKDALRSDLADEELAEPKRTGLAGVKQRMGEEWNSQWGKLNYAFAATDLLQGAGKLYAATNSGDYVTPEEKASAAGGLLQGAGALVGTALGGWGGGIIGGGIGSFAENILTANQQREQSIRQTSELVGTVTGGDANAVREFTEALRSGTAAVKEVQQAFSTLTNAGPGVNTTTSLAGAEAMSNALGERFNPALSGVERAIGSDPILRGLQPELGRTGGRLTASQYGDLAVTEAFQGDFAASNNALTLQEGAQATQYDKDKAFTERWADTPIWTKLLYPSKNGAALDAAQRMGTEAPDPNAAGVAAQTVKDRDAAFGLYLDSSSAQEQARAGVGLAETRLSLSQASGGGSQAMAVQVRAIDALVKTSTPALEADAKGIQDYLTAHPDMAPQMRNALQRTLDDDLAAPEKMALLDRQEHRRLFDTEQQEQAAGYGLSQSAAQSALVTGRLSGRTNAEMQGQEDALLAGQRAFAGQQRQDASSSLVSPAERAAMQAHANALDTDAAQQGYAFKMGGYAQTLGGIDLRADRAGLGVTQAQIGGGAGDVYQARGQEVDAFRAKIAELSTELQRGALTVEDRTAKERELTAAQGQAVRADFTRTQDYFGDQSRLTDTQESTAAVGLGRRMARRGNAGYDPNITALAGAAVSEAEGHLAYDRAHYSGNRQLLAGDENRVATAAEQYQERLDAANPYHRTGAQVRRFNDDETNAEMAQISPWMAGPEGSPLTRNSRLIDDYRRDMAGLQGNRAKHLQAGDWRDEDETGFRQELNADRLKEARAEHDLVYGGLLPQEVQARIGAPGGGAGVAVQPLAAVAAAYGAYNPTQGSFGAHPNGYHSSVGMAPEGGAAGAFALHLGIGNTGSEGGAAAKTADNTAQLVRLFSDFLRHVQTANQHPPQAMGQVSAYARGLNP